MDDEGGTNAPTTTSNGGNGNANDASATIADATGDATGDNDFDLASAEAKHALLNKQKHYIKFLASTMATNKEIVQVNSAMLDRDDYKDVPLLHHNNHIGAEMKPTLEQFGGAAGADDNDDKEEEGERGSSLNDDESESLGHSEDRSETSDTLHEEGDRKSNKSRRKNKSKANGGASISTKSSKSKQRPLTEEEKVFYELFGYCKLGEHKKLEEFINKVELEQEEKEKGLNNYNGGSGAGSDLSKTLSTISDTAVIVESNDATASDAAATAVVVPNYINIEKIINTPDWGGTFPMHIACMMRNVECIKVLIRNGANVNVKDAMGRTGFYYFKQLADINEKKKGTENDDMFQIKQLVKVCNPEYVDSEEESIKTYKTAYKNLLDAAYRGDINTIKRALSADITYLEYVDTKGHTPLMYALMGDQVGAAKLLLDYGADFYRRNGDNRITIDFMKNIEHTKDLRTYNYWRGTHCGPEVTSGKSGIYVPPALRSNHGPMRVSYFIKVEEDESYQKRLQVMKQFHKEKRRIAKEELLQFGFYVLTRQNYALCVVNEIVEIARDTVRDMIVDDIIDREYLTFPLIFEDELSESAAEYKRNCDAIAAANLRARLEREELARQKAAAELAARLEAERLGRLKLEAETAERVRRLQHAKRRKEAELQAITEWNESEEQLREEKWLKFVADRPHRVHLYRRMRLSLKAIGGIPYSPRTDEENPLVDTYS